MPWKYTLGRVSLNKTMLIKRRVIKRELLINKLAVRLAIGYSQLWVCLFFAFIVLLDLVITQSLLQHKFLFMKFKVLETRESRKQIAILILNLLPENLNFFVKISYIAYIYFNNRPFCTNFTHLIHSQHEAAKDNQIHHQPRKCIP